MKDNLSAGKKLSESMLHLFLFNEYPRTFLRKECNEHKLTRAVFRESAIIKKKYET